MTGPAKPKIAISEETTVNRVVGACVIAVLHVSTAGAAEPLEWSDGRADPLFELGGETWTEREFGSMLREARAYDNPAGVGDEAVIVGENAVGEEESESAALSKECIALRADAFGDVGKILRAGCKPTTEQMSRLMDNPLGNVAMWINQLDIMSLNNDQVSRSAEVMTNYMGILQFPKGITENWNVINRIVYNIPSVPIDQDKVNDLAGFPPSIPPPGGGPTSPPPSGSVLPIDLIEGRTSGFGDLIYLGLASPKQGISHGEGKTSVWGLGAGLSFPSASDDLLGSGKWSMGPSALYAYLGQKWKLGALVQTYFSYAGDKDRDDVSTLNLQLFYYYSVTPTISIGAGPNIRADFQADSGDQWTVPLGIGIGYTRNIGKIPVRFMVEYYGSVYRPDTVGTTHDVRILVIPAVPSGLIPFL
jgi:hypothetical protein